MSNARPRQFSLRALLLLTVAAAVVLWLGSGSLGLKVILLAWIAAIVLAMFTPEPKRPTGGKPNSGLRFPAA